MLIDPFQRKISYIRVSVTDRCDFRCTYCMSEDMEFLPKKNVLSLEELTLTTNGSQLDRYAQDLFNSGVRRINISLDSLNKNKFKTITRNGDFNKVLKGIMVAKKVGLKIKINTVALKGINDDEILKLVNWCGENKFSLTFIEVMPM